MTRPVRGIITERIARSHEPKRGKLRAMLERIGEIVYRIGAGLGLLAAIFGGGACIYSVYSVLAGTNEAFTQALAAGLTGLVGGMLIWMVARILLYALASR